MIIQKRHWKRGLFELIFPVLLVILFTWIKKEFTQGYEASKIDTYESSVFRSRSCVTKIGYSPASPWIDSFLKSIYIGEDVYVELESFANAAELDRFLNPERGPWTSRDRVMGIEFDDSLTVRSVKSF